MISDIGGTTTDIAVLRDGVPIISADGATVGGHQTMVSAVAMHTHGLGGDSQRAPRRARRRRGAAARAAQGGADLPARGGRARAGARACSTCSSPTSCPASWTASLLIAEHYEQRLASLEGVERAVLAAMGGRVAVGGEGAVDACSCGA